MDVLIWQVGILLGICLASLLFGKAGWIFASGAAALWTVAMVFTSWLTVLQLVTVSIGFRLGATIVKSPSHSDNRTTAWTLIIAGGVGIWWLVNKIESSDRQSAASPATRHADEPQFSKQYEMQAPPSVPATVTNDSGDLSSDERASLDMACSSASIQGPAAYDQCVQYQMTQLRQAQRVTPDGLSIDEKVSLDMVCSSASLQGPAAYNQCVQYQMTQLRNVPRAAPDGLSFDEKVSLDMACSSASMQGPAAYNQCVQYQMIQLRQVQRVNPDGLSIDEKVSLNMDCSSAFAQGPAAYNKCVENQLYGRR